MNYLVVKILIDIPNSVEMSEVNNKLEVNEDLAKERRKCNFDMQEMTFIIDGGEKNTIARRKIGISSTL